MSDAKIAGTAHGGITLARFAELSALVRAARPLREILAEHGLSDGEWRTVQSAWNRAIEEELERGDDTLVVAFADALAEAKERLRRAPADGSGAAPFDPDGPTPLPTSVAAPAPLSAPGSRPPSAVSPWARGIASPLPPSPLAAAAPSPFASSPPPSLVPSSAPSPFAPPPPLAAAAPAAEGERPELNETSHLPLRAFVAAKVLPFEAGAAPPQASRSEAATPAPTITSAEPAKQRSFSLGGTADLVIPRVLPKPLPFSGAETTAIDMPVPLSPAPVAPETKSPAPRPATLISGRDPGLQAAPAPAAAASAPRLTIEQFASLTAERAEHPERDAQIRARYFVAQEGSWAALQREWQQRMEADPNLRLRVQDLVIHYRKWLQRTGG